MDGIVTEEDAELPGDAAAAPRENKPDIVDAIAAYIRQNTRQEKLTAKSSLAGEPANVPADALDEVADGLLSRENAHIAELCGKNDRWYFCDDIMAANYANMLLLTEEKDIYNTIATVVRFNCKTYPRPTSLESLTQNPFYLDKERAQNAVKVMKNRGEYGDIKTVTASNGAAYYYSTQFMSETYAQSLAQYEEVDWRNYP
jgi:hypothetical protein